MNFNPMATAVEAVGLSPKVGDEVKCSTCNMGAWARPYGAREFDVDDGVMKKWARCIDRIYNENPDAAERGGFDLMFDLGYRPVNKHGAVRQRKTPPGCTRAAATPQLVDDDRTGSGLSTLWLGRLPSR